MVKLWVRWFPTNDGTGPWFRGRNYYKFETYRDACEFCHKYTGGNKHPIENACLEQAEISEYGAMLVFNGNLVCADCGGKLDDLNSDGYALCEGCNG